MSVASFSALENDMDARSYFRKLDQNGRVAALIKVETTAKGFSFDVGSLGVVDVDHTKTAETWVYVPSGVIRMTIQHAELGTIRDYEFPISIREATVYRLVLTSDEVKTIVNQRANGQYLALSISPADIELTISVDGGAPSSVVGGEFSRFLSSGSHSYTISAPMYQSVTKEVEVSTERIIEQVTMTPNWGYLDITATPEARITINNIASGSTPISQELELGTYSIKLTAPNYQPHSQSVTLSTPLEHVVIDKELEPYYSQISLMVPMNEATISITDEVRGKGSWQGVLMPATYIVKAEREGHRPTLYTLEVQNNTPQTITLESPSRMEGSLNVDSNTINADLYINGELLGQTPNYFEGVIVGEHNLTLKKAGYVEQTKSIVVEEGRIANVSFTLERSAASTTTRTTTQSTQQAHREQAVKTVTEPKAKKEVAKKQPKVKAESSNHQLLMVGASLLSGEAGDIPLSLMYGRYNKAGWYLKAESNIPTHTVTESYSQYAALSDQIRVAYTAAKAGLLWAVNDKFVANLGVGFQYEVMSIAFSDSSQGSNLIIKSPDQKSFPYISNSPIASVYLVGELGVTYNWNKLSVGISVTPNLNRFVGYEGMGAEEYSQSYTGGSYEGYNEWATPIYKTKLITNVSVGINF